MQSEMVSPFKRKKCYHPKKIVIRLECQADDCTHVKSCEVICSIIKKNTSIASGYLQPVLFNQLKVDLHFDSKDETKFVSSEPSGE